VHWILAPVAQVQVPAETTMKTIGITPVSARGMHTYSHVYASLADNHLSGMGWRQQGHAAVQNQAMQSPSGTELK